MSATTPILLPTGTWEIDPAHTDVGFQVRHAGIAKVRGRFEEFTGSVVVREDGTITAGGSVEVASIDTRNAQRDEHLRSPDFFDVGRYPLMTFTSHRIEPTGGDELTVVGELTMHGVTRELRLRGEIGGTDVDPDGLERIGLSLEGRLSRADYGMTFNIAMGSGNVLVGDTVRLLLDISAIRAR